MHESIYMKGPEKENLQRQKIDCQLPEAGMGRGINCKWA